MRTVITLIYVVVFLIMSYPVSGIQWLIHPKDERRRKLMLFSYVHWGFRCVERLSGSKVTVKGLENIPKDRPAVYISNHQSIYDIVVTYSRIPGFCGFIAKKSLLQIPILGWLMKRLYSLGIDRSNLKDGLKVILKAIDEAKNGISICIYPEGTRSKDGEVHEFHAGSFKVATKSGCPVIPVAVNGTRDILEYHFPNIKKSNVTLSFGKPIETKGMSRDEQKELPNRVRDEIIEMMKG